MRPAFRWMMLAGAVVGAAAVLADPGPAYAAEITVTTEEDSLDLDGECSLREAVIAANTNVPVDTCTAGDPSDADTIQLIETESSDAVYRLTIEGEDEDLGLTGDLDITSHIVICCMGTIDGAGLDRAIDIHPAAEIVVLKVTAFTGGDAGSSNGGAIRARQDCGGGMRTRVGLVSHIVGNAATNGGALAVEGCVTVDILWSTFEDNAATADGGAVALYGGAADLSVEVSTFTGNRAGGRGGAINAETTDVAGMTIAATTIADNLAAAGGGIAIAASDAESDLINVLLAQNVGGNCAIESPLEGHHNLSDDASCPNLGANAIVGVDARLGPLEAMFGSPSYGLLPDSPAIDAGITLGGEAIDDQRGVIRPVDGDGDGIALWDIGSVEAPAPEPEPIPTAGDGGGAPRPAPTSIPDTAIGAPATFPSPGGVLSLLVLSAAVVASARRLCLTAP